MDELLKRVLAQLGKTEDEFNSEVEELTKGNEVTKLKDQNADLNLQIIELWETLIIGGVA